MAEDHQRLLRRLQALNSQPEEQSAYALELLQGINLRAQRSHSGREIVQAALRVLARRPHPDARPVLLDLYARYATKGVSLDAGTYARAAILHALRPLLQPMDVSLLVDAVQTYEFPPPQFTEEAVLLRAAAIVCLNEWDDQLARFHAVRLLVDEHTERMSGEPALSAAQVLGSQGDLLPLYQYVCGSTLPDICAECLHHLTELPPSLLPTLVGRFGESKHDVVLAGLFDLLLHHNDGPQQVDYLVNFLRSSNQEDAYHYLVTAVVSQVASGQADFLPTFIDAVRNEKRATKIDILCTTLSILAHNQEIAALIETLSERAAD